MILSKVAIGNVECNTMTLAEGNRINATDRTDRRRHHPAEWMVCIRRRYCLHTNEPKAEGHALTVLTQQPVVGATGGKAGFGRICQNVDVEQSL